MKTRSFSQLTFEELPDGMCKLYASSPGEASVTVELSPNELEIFLVEILNAMQLGRLVQVANRVKRDLERETRKA